MNTDASRKKDPEVLYRRVLEILVAEPVKV
jgi:hypothetical protein